MIDGLIAGKVYGQPQSRTDSRGRVFALGKIRAATAAGESLFVSCIVFGDAATQFLALADGDPVAAAGSITPKTWTDREGQAHPALELRVINASDAIQDMIRHVLAQPGKSGE